MNKKHVALLWALALTTVPFLFVYMTFDWSVAQVSASLLWSQLALSTASVFGFIGIMLCLWEVILGARFITRLFGPDILWCNRIHQLVGIYGGVFIILHPLLETYAYGQSLFYSFLPSLATQFETTVTFGRIASLLFLIIWVTSAVVRGKITYRPWLYLHYLAYLMLPFVYLHIQTIGSVFVSNEWLRVVFNVMLIAGMVVAVIRIAYAAGLMQKKYRVVSVKRVGPTVLCELVPLGKHIVPGAGQFCYMQLRAFGESHPFSVMDYDHDTGALIFGVKTFGKFSKKVFDLQVGATVFLDGPFGVFTAEGHNANPKVLIAGGIGITPLYHLVRRHGDRNTYLLHCNRTRAEAVGREMMHMTLGNRYTDILSDESCTEPDVCVGRLDEQVLRQRVPQEVWANAEVFFCGNQGFYEATRKILIGMGVPKHRIHFEAFAL